MSPAAAKAALGGVNWGDARRKGWHALLMLGSAYAATNPQYAWAVPVLTGMAGISAPPNLAARAGSAALVLVAAGAAALLSV